MRSRHLPLLRQPTAGLAVTAWLALAAPVAAQAPIQAPLQPPSGQTAPAQIAPAQRAPAQRAPAQTAPADTPLVRKAPYGRYVIQPSDTIAISYRYSPEYDFTGPVQPDGFISPPLIGEVMVAGLTLEQAHDRVLAKASERLRDPEIFVVLKDFEKPSFAVSGEVAKPGRFELRGRTGVLEAMAMAGGFNRSAKHSEVVLFRRYDDEHVITQVIDVKQLTRRSTRQANIELQSGDFLWVPQSRISKIERLVPLASVALLNPFIW
jgi:protein involved in polysaccharide export with SLBB domain